MLVRELMNMLAASDRDAEVLVALSQEDGTTELFDIEDVSVLGGVVHIEINVCTNDLPCRPHLMSYCESRLSYPRGNINNLKERFPNNPEGVPMPRMQILSSAEFNAFERPPAFSTIERQRFFDLSPRFEHLVSSFRTPTNQICFVLALGYFRATKRFFARQFREAEAEYVAQQLGILPGVFDLRSYSAGAWCRDRRGLLDIASSEAGHLGRIVPDATGERRAV